jgi:thiosulfate/3-mercaptopyruvate sulfurtransferase
MRIVKPKSRLNLRLKPWFLSGLVLTALCVFAFIGQPFGLNAQNSATKITFVSPDWVRANASDPNLRILDVRIGFIDYFNGHLPNAVNLADNTVRGPRNGLPVQYFEPEKLGNILKAAGVTDKSRVLIYADGADILGSSAIAYVLERIGLAQSVNILDGGLTGYRATQETVKEFPKYEPGNLTVKDIAVFK